MNEKEIKAVKKATRFDSASCLTCAHLSSDDDGSDYSQNSWPVCNKEDRYQYLKSFPFKKEMNCWWPEYWGTHFVDLVKYGEDSEWEYSFVKFRQAVETALIRVEVETRHMWE